MSNSCMFVFILSSKLVIKQTFISPRVNSFKSRSIDVQDFCAALSMQRGVFP